MFVDMFYAGSPGDGHRSRQREGAESEYYGQATEEVRLDAGK
jgi:hypothetical protein